MISGGEGTLYMGEIIPEWTMLNLWKKAFKKLKVCLNRLYDLNCFKGCLSQILLGQCLRIHCLTLASLCREAIKMLNVINKIIYYKSQGMLSKDYSCDTVS